MTLKEARESVGRGVVYRARPNAQAEQGEIVRVNDTYVFVRFRGDITAKACRPDDLQPLVAW